MAAQQGFSSVFVLQGGLPAWEERGYAIYAGPEYEKRNPNLLLTPVQVQKLVETDPNGVVVVDVREPNEFGEKHLPGAVNIPLAALLQRVAELDRTKTIVLYCISGGRSYNAIRKLRKLGFTKVGHVTLEEWERAGFRLVVPPPK